MHSPLPDARALEEGIIEDELPSRLSWVQDNVRNLLRNSRLGSVYSSPPATHNPAELNNGLPTPPHSPAQQRPLDAPETIAPTSATESENGVPNCNYREAVQQMAHQSSLFNMRAVAALNHPDLTDPSLEAHLQQQKAEHRQRNAWKRSRHGRGRKRTVAVELGSSQTMMCVFAALMLAATVATYIVLATTSNNITPTFHILFILGIILATIVFAHSMMRVLLFNSRVQSVRKAIVVSSSRNKRRHHRHNRSNAHHQHAMPAVIIDSTAFVPATPIPVHMPSDEVRPDSREAEPTATVDIEGQSQNDWDKEVDTLPNPPPAYGRWRGSVRANPDLLHWQAVPSPTVVGTPALPSPTYEEAVAEEQTRPPSYVTRDSPARRRAGEGAEEIGSTPNLQARVDDDAEAEPEMIEVRGIGFAL